MDSDIDSLPSVDMMGAAGFREDFMAYVGDLSKPKDQDFEDYVKYRKLMERLQIVAGFVAIVVIAFLFFKI